MMISEELERMESFHCMTVPEFVRRYLPGVEVPPHHAEAYEFLTSNRTALWECPVGHGKSTACGFVLPLYRICMDRNVRMAMVSRTRELASDLLRRVRLELERNDALRADFGEFRDPGGQGQWTDTKLRVSRTLNLKEPTITAVGLGGAMEGLRLDLAILDDPIDITSMIYALERQRSKEWFDHTLRARMEPAGSILVIGTPWHPDDGYAYISRLPGWAILKHVAISGEGRGRRALWPERFSLEELDRRREGNELAFLQKYMCDPQAISGRVWKSEWIRFFDDAPGDFDRIVQGWDLAISERTTADFTAGVTVGAKAGRWYILDVFRGRVSFPMALAAIRDMADRWRPESIAIESNAYQMAVVQQLRMETGLPIIPQRATRDKVTRLMGLGVDFENGRFVLRRGLNDFVREFVDFPDGTHDDQLDALWHARERLRWATRALDIDIDGIGGF